MKEIFDIAAALQRSVKNVQLYADTAHPRCQESLQDLSHRLTSILEKRSRIQLVVSQGKAFVDGLPITGASPFLAWMIQSLGERKINGFVFGRGVTADELATLVKILMMKPQKLEEAGGPGNLLLGVDAKHLRLSHVRYEELRDGEVVVVADQTGGGQSAGGGAFPGDDTAGGGKPFIGAPAAAGDAGGIGGDKPGIGAGGMSAGPGGGLSGGRGVGTGSGKGTGEASEAAGGFPDLASDAIPDEEAMRMLAGTISGWFAEIRPTAAGRGGGPSGPGAGSGSGSGGSEPERRERFQQFVASLTRYMREKSVDLMSLQNRLRDLGVSKDDLEELLEVAAWENLGLDDRIKKCLETTVVFELPLEKVLAFILDLLRLERRDDAAHIVEKLGSGLFMESPEVRKSACDAFNRMTVWMHDPGVPQPIESLFERALLTHFVRETDPVIQQRTLPAVANLYDHWLETQQIDKAYQTLRKLEAVTGAASEASPWKRDVFDQLLERLTSPERMPVLFAQMFSRDVETAAAVYHPLLVFFGDRAALRLLDALGTEEDRGKRGRLIKALKAIGKPALQHLQNALRSPTWYLVRNAVNLIGDMLAIDLSDDVIATLRHEDDRVRRAAARALGKIGGLRAERGLADALASNEGETRGEILSSLAAMKADSVVAEVLELAKPRRLGRGDDPLRIRAIETAGQIGSNAAIAPLAELLKRKGLLGGQEPAEIRIAAAQALAAIGTPEAREALDAVLAAEPDNQLRGAVMRIAGRR